MRSFKAPAIGLALLLAGVLSTSAFAAKVDSTAEKSVNVARVVKVINLVSKPGLMVNVSVVDLGGSTDVSPTQVAYLNLYAKGEMFSTDAVFPLGAAFEVKGAKRRAAGLYEVSIVNSDLKPQTLKIDARQATVDIQAVSCEEEFDCAASENFAASIEVQ